MTTLVPPDGPDLVPAYQRYVRQGGLFRCCVATAATSNELTGVGSIMDCMYEPPGNARLRVAADGVWEWNH